MKNKNFTAGLILCIVGLILILRNFDLLNINWDEVINFWPLLLIYAGLNTLYGNQKSKLIPMLMIAITIFSIILFFVFKEYSGTTFDL